MSAQPKVGEASLLFIYSSLGSHFYQTPSPPDASSSPPYPLVNNSKPKWLGEDPCGLVDNHEDAEKDIWIKPLDEKHWDECRTMLKKHDDKALQEWNDDINTQLLVVRLVFGMRRGLT